MSQARPIDHIIAAAMDTRLISRRQLLGHGAALACACHTLSIKAASAAGAAPRLMVEPALSEPGRAGVRLGEGPLLAQFEQQQRLYLNIDDDKLLKPFRLRAGQPAPGADMGGWYDQSADFHIDPKNWSTANWHGFIPGHGFGQYLSGLARGYAITGDHAAKDKVTTLVRKYARTISPRFFADYTLPAYTYDKIVVGLIDAFHHAGVVEAKAALDMVTDAALPFLPDRALTREERRLLPYSSEAQIWDEPYTLPENLFLAWQRGMGDRYRSLAVRFLQDAALFNPLAQGKSPLAGKHAYSHVNALSSAMQAYLATGEDRYLAAARNGFAFVQAQSFATGGWGANEELLGPDDTKTMADMLRTTHRSFETPCGAYGHFKIARYLLRVTKDSRYGDSMERVLYNTILGAKPTLPDGSTFYYSDYNQRAHKFYRDEKWPCCSGTFIQLTADYGISAYLLDEQNLYVNLYAPSKVTATLGGADVTVTQTTGYPLSNQVRLRVDGARPASFGIRLRIPAWAGAKTQIKINGQADGTRVQPGTFAALSRTWKPGDAVDVTFDMGLRLEPLNQAHPEMVALLTGPLALFPVGARETSLTRQEWLTAARRAPDEWVVTSKRAEITLRPFMAITDQPYRLYSQLRPT
jgi:hypothetical protein